MDKIICVGKNYLAHAKELGEAQPETPVLFLKPPSVLKQAKHWNELITARFPEDQEVVPECELVLEVGVNAKNLSTADTALFINRITVGLDVTLRAKQRELKRLGQPWTTAKVFPDAAIIGPWVDISALPEGLNTPFSLETQGILHQQANAMAMLYHPFELLKLISQAFPICAGDIIFTGTPAGLISIQADSKVKLSLGNHSFSVQWY